MSAVLPVPRVAAGYRGAVAMLVLAALCWGSGNVANKTLLADVGPLTALGLRAVVAAVVLWPFAAREAGGRPDGAWLRSTLGLAVMMILSAGFQQAAYQWTTVTNVGFLVNTCTVMTPLAAWLLLRERVDGRVVLAAGVTLAGAWAMSGAGRGGAGVNPGDLACLASAGCYALGAVMVGRHLMRHGRPVLTTLVQFVVMAVVVLPWAAAVEAPDVAGLAGAAPEILYLGVVSTAGAFLLMTLAQRHVTAAVAVMVTSLESVFGAAGAFLLLGELLSPAGMTGAALIVAAIAMTVGGKAGARQAA